MHIQIAAKKDKPTTSQQNIGVSPVTYTAGPQRLTTQCIFTGGTPEWSDSEGPAV